MVEAESSTVHAALVLTDIEGWTSCVERLCSAGPEGLDELARYLNSYFVELTEIVYGHGGDLLTVTGDAFLCCWLADGPGDLDAATARGAQAALAFQQTAERRASPGGDRLLTRMGIAAGELDVASSSCESGSEISTPPSTGSPTHPSWSTRTDPGSSPWWKSTTPAGYCRSAPSARSASESLADNSSSHGKPSLMGAR